jgi:hypothetical protein
MALYTFIHKDYDQLGWDNIAADDKYVRTSYYSKYRLNYLPFTLEGIRAELSPAYDYLPLNIRCLMIYLPRSYKICTNLSNLSARIRQIRAHSCRTIKIISHLWKISVPYPGISSVKYTDDSVGRAVIE